MRRNYIRCERKKVLTGGQKSSWKSTTIIAGLNSDSAPMLKICVF